MSALADFAAALRDPASPPPARLGATAARFDVHRNTRMLSLVDAMVTSYPVTRALVGDAFFNALARACVLHAPPRTPVITDYLPSLPAFIAIFAPAQAMPWLAEIATLESLRVASYHAADATPIGADALAPWLQAPDALAHARVRVHPAARWFRARHAAHALWCAHQGLDDPSAADLSAIVLDEPGEIVVTRPHLDVHVATVPAGTCALLDALVEGHALGEAMAHALTDAPHTRASDLFTALLEHALIAAVMPGH